MKSRKALKRSSSNSRKADFRKGVRLDGAGAIERLEDRRLMTVEPWSDGLYYPPIGQFTAYLPPSLSYEQYVAISKVQFGDGPQSRSGGEGAGGFTSVSEVEPNNVFSQAQFVPLGNGPGQSSQVDVLGALPRLGGVFDEDVYAFDLKAGDIIDARVTGSNRSRIFDVSILNGSGIEMAANQAPIIGPIPQKSPLTLPFTTPVGASVATVIPADGRYYARVSQGDLPYTLSLRTFRAPLESEAVGVRQKLFLDFDGATIRRDIFGAGAAGNARLSPLSRFLTGWGLTPADESMVIDKIIASVKSRFTGNLPFTGNNGYFTGTGVAGDFDIEILNSRDHADPWGQPNVSRIIIGGTIQELGIPTVGIAESIDVGNFDTEETAVTLLDLILPFFGNGIPRAASVPLVDVLTESVGAVTAHEAGHFFGAWHTLNSNASNQIMDTGGNIPGLLGVGPDGIYGTADDKRTMFGTDQYDPFTSLVTFGMQNSAATIAAGLSTGTVGAFVNGKLFFDANINRVLDANEPGLQSWRVYADINNDGVFQVGEPQTISRADGTYTLALTPGSYIIREDLLPVPGFKITTPAATFYTVTVTNGQVLQNFNFGNERVDQTVTGFKFNDLNGNGFPDVGEPRIAGVFVYIDLDNDASIDLGEPQARTGVDGRYTLRFPGPGVYAIREVIEAGYVQTLPGPARENRYIVTVTGNAAVDGPNLAGLNFGNRLFLDLGDAPNSYGTLRASNGAAHGFIAGLFLGANWDAEQDGQPTLTALGDDLAGALDPLDEVIDDEDGVQLARPLARSATNLLSITATNSSLVPAYVHAWIDLNGDGDFTDSGENVVSGAPVSTGTQAVSFPALGGAKLGDTYARVRLSHDRVLGPTGLSSSGEVEDYRVTIVDAPQIALNDTFQVSRNSTLNSLDVTANDFKLPGEVLTIVSAGPSRAGGILQITSDNRVLYTPPSGFIGTDVFSYTVQTSTGETSTASVTITVNLFFEDPRAIDDSFNVPTNAISYPLNVLANDIEGRAGALSIISVTQPNLGGQITIATGGQSLRYTPARGLGDTEQFTYTVADASGKTSTAIVTLHTLPGAQLNDDVLIKLIATDLNGTPITAVPQGQDFRIDVFLDDLRDNRSVPILVASPGVYAAYLDLLYNLQLVTTVPSAPGSRFDFDVTFFNNYDNLQLGDATTPGIIDEFGAFNSSFSMNQPNPVRMASVRFSARSPGIATFTPDPAEGQLADTILFDTQGTPVPVERIRYEGTTIEIVGDSTEFPQAVDDSFTTNIPAGTLNFPLNVLSNDRPGSTNVIRLTSTIQPVNGSVVINNNGTPNDPTDDRILYTPNTGFVGTDSFKYTIQDARAVQSTATVTVRVGSTAQTDANDDVSLRLQVYKIDGTPLADGETLPVGSKFQLRGFVKDLRSAFSGGVFAAFEDVLYSSTTVSPDADSNNPRGFNIVFGPNYSRVPPVNSGDIRTAGLLNEVGAVQSDNGGQPLGPEEQLLFTVTFTANRVGAANFIGDPADILPLHDTLLFQPPTAVVPDRIRYSFDSFSVVAAGNVGGLGATNPNNAFDVNADGSVSAIDVLNVINALNTTGSGALSGGEGEGPVKLFLDVNADGTLSAMDALMVINHLNRRGAGEGESSVPMILSNCLAAAVENALGSTPGVASESSAAILASDSAAIILPPDALAGSCFASEGFGESDDLGDLVEQLAPDVGSIWKRK